MSLAKFKLASITREELCDALKIAIATDHTGKMSLEMASIHCNDITFTKLTTLLGADKTQMKLLGCEVDLEGLPDGEILFKIYNEPVLTLCI